MPKHPDLKALKKKMEEKGLTAEELAEKTGIKPSVLKGILEGTRELRVSEIYGLAEALELNDTEKSLFFFSE